MRSEPIYFSASLLLAAVAWHSAAAATTTPTCKLPSTQGKFCKHIQTLLHDVAAHANQQDIDDDMSRLLVPTVDGGAFVSTASPSIQSLLRSDITDQNSAFNAAVDQWLSERQDVQSGATPNASGSTSLVAKTGLSTLLSAAYEVGAFTQSTTGNTATFHLNAGGFLNAIAHDPVVSPDALKKSKDGKLHDPVFSWNRLDASVSVDLNQSASSSAAVAGPANSSAAVPQVITLPSAQGRLGAVTARYSLRAPFDPRSKEFLTAWHTAYDPLRTDVQSAGKQLTATANALVAAIPPSAWAPALVGAYTTRFQQDAAAGDGAKLETDFEEYYEKLLVIAGTRDKTFMDSLSAAQVTLAAFAEINQTVLDNARDQIGYSLTVEGDFNRPAQQPETYTGRIIYSHPNGRALFTANGAFTVYGPMQPGARYNRLRDGQIAGQFDTPLGDPKKNFATFSAGFYMQYQTDPSVLNITSANLVPGTTIALPSNAQVLLGPSGLIVIGQAKVTINAKGGLKIPLAFEGSNKTDLLNATDVRGNFGISYDFSSFSNLFGAK